MGPNYCRSSIPTLKKLYKCTVNTFFKFVCSSVWVPVYVYVYVYVCTNVYLFHCVDSLSFSFANIQAFGINRVTTHDDDDENDILVYIIG